MRRLAGIYLVLAALGAALPDSAEAVAASASATVVRDPDARPGEQPGSAPRGAGNRAAPAGAETEPGQAAAEPRAPAPASADSEPADTEPLAPIETTNAIRVNANVSLPQDI